MKKASELLNLNSGCASRRSLNLNNVPQQAILRHAIKVATVQAFQRKTTDLSTIATYLDDALDEYTFQNPHQRTSVLKNFSKAISEFVSNELGTLVPTTEFHVFTPADTAMFAGETYLMDGDFYTEKKSDTGELLGVDIFNIRTGRVPKAACPATAQEFAEYIWARTKYPSLSEEQINVYDYYLLPNKTNDTFNQKQSVKNGLRGGETMSDVILKTEEKFSSHVCTPEECASCPQYMVDCGFHRSEKPRVENKAVKPIGDISLSHQQQAVIDKDSGFTRVVAGAGAGKTLVTALRTVNLLQKGVKPETLFLLTFTIAGAKEMRDRINAYCADLGVEANTDKITIATFNSFCQSIIDKNYIQLGYLRAPAVIEDFDACQIISDILSSRPAVQCWDYGTNYAFQAPQKYGSGAVWSAYYAFEEFRANGISRRLAMELTENSYMDIATLHSKGLKAPSSSSFIGRLRGMGYSKEEALDIVDNVYSAYEMYRQKMKDDCLITYDDQPALVAELLRKNPTFFDKFGLEHIVVDEAQDNDKPETELLKSLMDTPAFKSFMMVGDASQSIYGFRGSYVEQFIDPDKVYGHKFDTVYLSDNHRSMPEIIGLANKIGDTIVENAKNTLVATRKGTGTIHTNGFYRKEDEVNFIVDQIENLIKSGEVPENICVNGYKRNFLNEVSGELTKRGIPVAYSAPVKLTENSLINIALLFRSSYQLGIRAGFVGYLTAYSNGEFLKNNSDADVERAVDAFKERIDAEGRDAKDFISYLEDLDPEQLDETYQFFLDKLRKKPTLEAIYKELDNFSTFGNNSEYRRTADYSGVVITTAHSAKGLEWKHVFCSLSDYYNKMDAKRLKGYSESYLGSTDAASIRKDYDDFLSGRFKNDGNFDEMKRLLYTAVTRAKDNLYITSNYAPVMERQTFGEKDLYITPNPFYQLCTKLLGRNEKVFDLTEYELVTKMEKMAAAANKLKNSGKPVAVPVTDATLKLLEDEYRLCFGGKKALTEVYGLDDRAYLADEVAYKLYVALFNTNKCAGRHNAAEAIMEPTSIPVTVPKASAKSTKAKATPATPSVPGAEEAPASVKKPRAPRKKKTETTTPEATATEVPAAEAVTEPTKEEPAKAEEVKPTEIPVVENIPAAKPEEQKKEEKPEVTPEVAPDFDFNFFGF